VFLLGAGASRPAEIPTMPEMWKTFTASGLPGLESYFRRFHEEPDPAKRNIEALLMGLRSVSNATDSQNTELLSRWSSDAAKLAEFVDMRNKAVIAFEARKFILRKVSTHGSLEYLNGLLPFLSTWA